MGERTAPRARDRVIGARLRAVRKERTKLSLEAAAKQVQWSMATLSRIETGKRHISPEEVATLCTVYDLPIGQRNELIESAQVGHSAGWWDRPLPGVPTDMGTIASYEAEAVQLTDWSVNLVPGLLQTYEYAVGMMKSADVDRTDIEMRWMARLRRQQILGTLTYTAFIGEAALRTPFGGSKGLKEQLRHLAGALDRGVEVRIMRAYAPLSVMSHSWLLMEFPRTSPVVYVEAWNGSVFLHDEVADSYFALREQLDKFSLSPAESQAMLQKMAEEI